MFKNFTLLIFLGISSVLQAGERRLTNQELRNSWALYALVKYCKPDHCDGLQKRVQELLQRGAQPNIVFEHNTTALTLAQQKKLDEVVAAMQNNDPLQNVWDELERKGFLKKSKL